MKYELLPAQVVQGRTLHRVRALKVFGTVKAGDIGGWVTGESNLSQENLCWVFGDAQVSDNARVSGNAWVFGDAQVFGDARVSDNAVVKNRRDICWFTGVGTDHATLTAFKNAKGSMTLTRGCFCGSVDEFVARSQVQHDETVQHEYRLLIEVALSRLSLTA